MGFSSALKKARDEHILSQQELANKIGTTSPNVSRWERGITIPNPYYRRRLCEFFQMTARELFPDQENPEGLHEQQNTPAMVYEDTASGEKIVPALTDPLLEEIFFYRSMIPNPDEFFGRSREQRRVFSRIKTWQPASIVGPRRIGKTWLLHYLHMTARAKLGEHVLIGYIDAAQPSCSTLPQFFATALKELKIAESVDEKERNSLHALELGVKEVRERGMVPVLCVDKFERFCSIPELRPDMLYNLRALIQKQDGLGLVTASRQPLREVIRHVFGETDMSPFYNVFLELTLGPFTRAEAEKFLQVKGEQAGFTAEERGKLLQYAQQQSVEQWYPEDLQWVGTLLYDDKVLTPDTYRPQDPAYWQEFERRVSEGLREELDS